MTLHDPRRAFTLIESARCDRHHRDPDRPAAAGGAKGAGESNRTRCMNQEKQLGLAVQNFAQVNNGKLPSLFYVPPPKSFFRSILPYMELDNLNNAVSIYVETMPGIGCPSDRTCPTWRCPHGIGVGSYAPNYQVFGSTFPDGYHARYRIGNLPDGNTNVIFLAERFALPNGIDPIAENDWATDPGIYGSQFASLSQEPPQVGIRQASSDWTRPNTAHIGAMVVSLGDGSARLVSGHISQSTWWSLCVPDDGKVLGDDW